MTFPIDYFAYNNSLSKIAVNQKLVFAILGLFMAMLGESITRILIFLWFSFWLLVYAKIPLKMYISILLVTILFFLSSFPVFLINIVSQEHINLTKTDRIGNIYFQFQHFYVYFSLAGTQQFITILLRSLACNACLIFLMLTIPFNQILQVFHNCKCPLVITDLLFLMYRFIFILAQTAIDLKLAQQARGGYRTWKSKLFSISLLISQLFKQTFFRYQEFALGMESRGLSQNFLGLNLVKGYYSTRLMKEIILGFIGLTVLDLYLKMI